MSCPFRSLTLALGLATLGLWPLASTYLSPAGEKASLGAALGATRADPAAVPEPSSAVENEVREFTVEVDGSASGQYIMTVTKQESGILSMQCQANISFKHFFGTYRYTYEGVEHWKDGRLMLLTSKCNDDGTKTDVNAVADHENLRLKVNGRERNCRGDVWTTSYWLLANQKFHNQPVPLLDADTAKEFQGKLLYVGAAPVAVGGQQQNCYHFRVTGGPITPVDLWYDANHRLVRQEFTDQGRRVVFVLRSVRRS